MNLYDLFRHLINNFPIFKETAMALMINNQLMWDAHFKQIVGEIMPFYGLIMNRLSLDKNEAGQTILMLPSPDNADLEKMPALKILFNCNYDRNDYWQEISQIKEEIKIFLQKDDGDDLLKTAKALAIKNLSIFQSFNLSFLKDQIHYRALPKTQANPWQNYIFSAYPLFIFVYWPLKKVIVINLSWTEKLLIINNQTSIPALSQKDAEWLQKLNKDFFNKPE